MKTRDIEKELRNRGYESGTLYVLQVLNEKQNNLQKNLVEMAALQDKIIDSLANVVNGAGAMRAQFEKTMRERGLVETEEDLGPTEGLN